MVAILGNQIIGIPFVLSGKLFHHAPNLLSSHIRLSDEYRLPEREAIAAFRLAFENPRRGVLMSAERILDAVNCIQIAIPKPYNRRSEKFKFKTKEIRARRPTLNAGMVHSEAEPVSVAVNRSQIVDVEVHRHGS